jgi:hypothetical protein
VQRVFLVAFVICWGYFALWKSIKTTSAVQSGHYYFDIAVERDFGNPLCEPYATKPVNKLTKPEYSSEGGSCWHIYTYRQTGDQTLPLTLESYYSSRRSALIGVFSGNIGALTLLVALAFGLIYLIHKILLWVVAGFRK